MISIDDCVGNPPTNIFRGEHHQATCEPVVKPLPVVPAIPSADETGVPGLYVSGWFGLFAPKGTPKDVIARLNTAIEQALANPAVKTSLPSSDSTLPRANSGPRTGWLRSTRPRSRSGGQSSSRRHQRGMIIAVVRAMTRHLAAAD